MKKLVLVIAFLLFAIPVTAQIPVSTLVKISKAEDELRYDATLQAFLKSPNARIRERAALAAGRIGNDAAIDVLGNLAATDPELTVRTMAMFAIGEIESVKGADRVLAVLADTRADGPLRARAVEAAGKIAAANAKNEKAKELSKAIAEALDFEAGRRSMPHRDTIILGLTAVLRVRPEGSDRIAARFLGYSDERVRADAANTLTRIRAKNANEELRKMLRGDAYAVARANAARALGAAEDKEALADLMNAAINDADGRVRVSAIRSVAALKDASVASRLIDRGNALLGEHGKSKFKNPVEKSELLEIAATVGRLLAGTKDENAVKFLDALRTSDKYASPETEIALVRVAPQLYVESLLENPEEAFGPDWRTSSAAFQALGEIANFESNDANNAIKSQTRLLLVRLISGWIESSSQAKQDDGSAMAVPDLLRAFAAFKSENTSAIMRPILDSEPDPIVRAAVADILGEQKTSPENVEALKNAFSKSFVGDRRYNDATLAIMDALFKLDKNEASGSLLVALGSGDYLVRKKAFELLRDEELQKAKPGVPSMIENAMARKANQVTRVSVGSKLGMINLTDSDYIRAVSRKNGSVKAVLTTEKGAFTIVFNPEEAPLTVDNFIRLARSGYFNGLAVHRVVPNFVMQDGDNRGDGNGGPGWSIRCEVNTLPYERGAVGMALSGKDTGGSQWFVTHSPQPHLDGGYTVFGRVDQEGMKVVDSIVRGDKILSVKIIGR